MPFPGTAIEAFPDEQLTIPEYILDTKSALPSLELEGADRKSAASDRPCRVPHKQVERKYRYGINAKVDQLRDLLIDYNNEIDPVDLEDMGEHPRKLSKAIVLSRAIDFIQKSKAQEQQYHKTTALLNERITALQKLINCDNCTFYNFAMEIKISDDKFRDA
jgi:hypothetical protein